MEKQLTPINSNLYLLKEDIDLIVTDIAKDINEKISVVNQNEEIVFIGILKGAFIFLADLVRKVNFKHQINFITASSYGGSTETSGEVTINFLTNSKLDLKDKHLILVDEIIDTGLTFKEIVKQLKELEPKSIKTIALLDKISRRQVDFNPDIVGKIIPDKFVIGYGLDWNQQYRSLADIHQVNL